MEKVQNNKSLLEKYKIAWKGLNANKGNVKLIESKRFPKSMEISINAFKTNQNNSVINKTRQPQRRSKDKSTEKSKQQNSFETRKPKSKTNYKPQTAQINLYATQMIPSKQIDNKVNPITINTSDNLKLSSGKRKDKFLQSSKNNIWKYKSKNFPYASSNLSKTQMLPFDFKDKTSPHSIRDSNSSLVLETQRYKIRPSGVKHIQTKVVPNNIKNIPAKLLAYNDYFSK